MNRTYRPRSLRVGPAVAALIVIVVLGAGTAAAQAGRGEPSRGRAAGAPQVRGDAANAAEVQRLFDAYVVIRTQEALKLDDEHFATFLPKLTALQDTRRRNEQAHNRFVAELARLTAPNAQFDEAQAKEVLKSLQDLAGRAAAELRKAYDAVDQLLDVRQQARFRVFELQMERRKLDLVLQARRSGAALQPEPVPQIKKAPVQAPARK